LYRVEEPIYLRSKSVSKGFDQGTCPLGKLRAHNDQKRWRADLKAIEAAAAAAAVASDLSALSFAQTTMIVPGISGTTYANITCFGCRSKGHYSNECPKASKGTDIKKGVQLLQLGEGVIDPIQEVSIDYGFTSTCVNG